MPRGGTQIKTAQPERMCLITREAAPKSGLVRFVTGPDGSVVPDVLNKLPGRGYYVTADKALLLQAVQERVFARGAKRQVKVPDGLVDMIEGQLAQHLVALISMARKAGLAVVGFEKVKSWLADGKVKVLLQASDGAARGKSKLWTPQGARYFGCLTAAELGLAFGRDHAIHGALCSGGLSARVIEQAIRLRGLREDGGPATATKGH